MELLAVATGSASWKRVASIAQRIAALVRDHVALITGLPVVKTPLLWNVSALLIRAVAIPHGTLFVPPLRTFVEAVMAHVVMPMRHRDVPSRKRKYVFVNKTQNVARWPGMRVVPPWRRKSA